jgi:rubredoxin
LMTPTMGWSAKTSFARSPPSWICPAISAPD